MSSAFASFHLTIAAPHGDRYPVTARTQAGHEVSEDILLPLDDATLTVYQTALDYHTSIDESVVIAVGQLLYQALFQGTIAEAFATARTHADQQKVALRIHLAIDTDTRLSAAAALPWELMATAAGRPLMLEHALVRTFPWNDPTPDLGIPLGERIRLAVTSALPTELADHPIAAEDEVAIIRAAITHSTRPIDLIEVPHLTRDRLTDLLTNQRPHIVHHIGHGSIQRGMGYLDIERADKSRDRLSAREFSTMIHQSGVQLVVLNACHTSSAGESLLTSFAPNFITEGIPAVIGMQAAILNRTGHCFANAFYAALGTSGSIDTSLIEARKAIHADGHEHGAWGILTLYSRVPHGQLWGDRTPQPVDLIAQRDRERITKAAQQIESDRLLNLRLQGFVGRVVELAAIRRHIETMRPTGGYVLIKAAAGEGKSSSIAKLIQEAGITQTPHHFIALTTGREYQLGLLRAVVARLILKHELTVSYFPEESYPAMKGEFARILDELSKHGIQETIYLDGLDQLQPEIDGSRDLSFLPPQPLPGIVIVLGSRPDETLKPLEILHRVDYDLPPLSEGDALELWRAVQPDVSDSLFHDLYWALNGNALFVHLAADTMQGQSVVDATSLIRQIEQNPSNLFGITIDRMKGRSLADWRTIWKPMLALLLVAQEPLRLDVLGDLLGHDHDTMQDAVWVLGGLVSQGIDQRVALHHLLFRDYLAASVFNQREVKRWQQRLVDWCAIDLDSIWGDHADAIEQARRMYARQHYVTHLALAENWTTLWQVLDAGDYGEQKTRFDPSTRLYALDLDRGRASAINAGQSTEEHIQNLPRLWKYSLLRTSLTSRVDQWPDELFEVFAMLGNMQEVLERVELCSDLYRQVQLWESLIGWCTPSQQILVVERILQCILKFPFATQVSLLTTVATTIARQGNFELATRLIRQAIDRTNSIGDETDRAFLFCTIAQACIVTNNSLYAVMMLGKSIDIAYLQAKLLSSKKNLRCADILQEVVKIVATMDSTMDTTHLLDRLISIAYLIDEQESCSEILSIIARTKALRGHIDHAINTASAIPSEKIRSETFGTIAETILQQGNLTLAFAVVEKAIVIALSINDFKQYIKALSHVIEIMGRFDSMQVAPLIDDCISTIQLLDNPLKRAAALNALVKAITSTGKIDQAISLIQNIANDFMQDETYRDGGIIFSPNNLDHALDFIDGINQYTTRNFTLMIIAKTASFLSKFDQALTIASMITLDISRDETFINIIVDMISKGNLTLAIDIVESIGQASSRSKALSSIAKTAVTLGNNVLAMIVATNAMVVAQNAIEDWNRNETLSAVAQDVALLDLNDATTIAEGISNMGSYAQVLGTIAQRAALTGKNTLVISLVEKILSIADQIEDSFIGSNILGTMAQVMASIGDIEYATTLIHSIDENDVWARINALNAITEPVSDVGNNDLAEMFLEQAITITLRIEENNRRAYAFCKVAQTAATIGNLKIAERLLERVTTMVYTIADNEDIVSISSNIAQLMAIMGNVTMAETILGQASSIATTMSHNENWINAFISVVQAATTIGNLEIAETILEQALSRSSEVRYGEEPAEALMAIAKIAIEVGNFTVAEILAEKSFALVDLMTIEDFDDELTRNEILSTIAEIIGRTNIDKALSIIDSISFMPIRAKTLSTILQYDYQNYELIITVTHSVWIASKIRNDTWSLLQIISPLLKTNSWLAKNIFETERWVNDQLKRLG